MPVRVADMTGPQYEDFLEQMRLLVAEEAGLYEFPMGSVDVLPDGPREHGPWAWEDCSAALARWLEAGLLALYRRDREGLGPDLAMDGGQRVLTTADEWHLPTATDWVTVYSSNRGDELPPDEWKAMLADVFKR